MSQLHRVPRPPSILLALALLAGCRSYTPRDWSAYEGPGKEHFLAEEVRFPGVEDPLEPFNRAMASFNHVLLVGIIAPLGAVYHWTIPAPVRGWITSAFDNAYYPVRLFGNLTQGKLAESWTETQRFAVNTTVGVLGAWDPALELGVEPSDEDFGQSLGTWGWRDSTYLVLPFLGPSTIRDASGNLVDAAVDPLTWFPPATQVRSFDRLAGNVVDYRRFVETNYDPYEWGRTLAALQSELQIDDYRYADVAQDTSETQTLSAIFLEPNEPLFGREGETYEVVVPTTGKKLAYTLWLQPEPAPLVYFLPGTAGHRLSQSAVAAAEAAYEEGSSVVTISNALGFEFIERASSVPTPGFAPVDAHDVHVVLDAIDRVLRDELADRITARRLAGLSLGAMHVLYIAAAEADPDNELVAFDQYLALNAPVSFRHAIDQLDAFYNAPLVYPPEERPRRVEAILRKVLDLAEGDLRPGIELPFTQLEARFLIGLTFRASLASIVFQTQGQEGQGRLVNRDTPSRRAHAHREALEYSFLEYVYAFVLRDQAERRDDVTFDEAGVERLLELCDLRSIEDALAANDKITFVSNRNDFLLRPEDVEWLRETLGERAHFFERGGHLGNLHREDIQEAIHALVEENAEE